MNAPKDTKNDKINLFSALMSAFAAAFGIQNQKNRERDFKKGNIGIFILAGIIMTITLVGVIVIIVKQVV